MSLATSFKTPRSPLAPFPLIIAELIEECGGYEIDVRTDQAHGYDVEAYGVTILLPKPLLSRMTYNDFEAHVRPLIEQANDEILGKCCERWRVIAEPLGLKSEVA